MKVKELLAQLQKVNPESEVSFMMDDGCCGDWLDLEAYDYDATDLGKGATFIGIKFNSIAGYRSCIQSGHTKREDEAYWKDRE